MTDILPSLHLTEVPLATFRKKHWAICEISFDDDAEPVGYKLFYPDAILKDKEDWYDFYAELSHVLFHRTKYKLVRGKLKEIK